MSENSTLIKAVGNRAFIDLAKGVRNANKDLGQFGFTVQESTQATLDYLEQQVRSGRIDSLTRQQQIRETQQYMYQVSELSKITGKSRKQMMDDMRSTAQNVDIATATALLGAEAGERFREGLRKAGPAMTAMGSEMNAALTEVAAQTVMFGNIGLSPLGRVAAIVSDKMSSGIQGWVDALKRGESGNDQLSKVFEALGEDGGKSVAAIAQMARAGDDGAKSMMKLIVGFQTMDKEQKARLAKQLNLTDEQLEKQMASQAAALNEEQRITNLALNAQTAWRDAMGQIESIMIDIFAPALTIVGLKLQEFATMVHDLWKKHSDAIGVIFNKLGIALKPITDLFKKGLKNAIIIVRDIFDKVYEKVSAFATKIDWDGIIGVIGRFAERIAYVTERIFGVVSNFVENFLSALPEGLIEDTINTLLNVFDKVSSFFLSFYKLMDEIGIIPLLEIVFESLGWILGQIVDVLTSVATFFIDIFADIFDALGGFIDGIRRFVFMLKNPIDSMMMTSEEIDKELGIVKESKISETFTTAIGETNPREPERLEISPEILKQAAQVSGLSVEELKESLPATQEGIDQMVENAKSGDETSQKILDALELSNKLSMEAKAAREEQIKQTKKLRQEDYSMESP